MSVSAISLISRKPLFVSISSSPPLLVNWIINREGPGQIQVSRAVGSHKVHWCYIWLFDEIGQAIFEKNIFFNYWGLQIVWYHSHCALEGDNSIDMSYDVHCVCWAGALFIGYTDGQIVLPWSSGWTLHLASCMTCIHSIVSLTRIEIGRNKQLN